MEDKEVGTLIDSLNDTQWLYWECAFSFSHHLGTNEDYFCIISYILTYLIKQLLLAELFREP